MNALGWCECTAGAAGVLRLSVTSEATPPNATKQQPHHLHCKSLSVPGQPPSNKKRPAPTSTVQLGRLLWRNATLRNSHSVPLLGRLLPAQHGTAHRSTHTKDNKRQTTRTTCGHMSWRGRSACYDKIQVCLLVMAASVCA